MTVVWGMRRAGRHGAWVPTGASDAPLQAIDLGTGDASVNHRQLRRHGLAGWQPETTAGLLAAWQLTRKPGVFLDVGANAGVYSLLCRLLWPGIRAIAFEPSPWTVAAGRRWAQANGVDVAFEEAAVSDTQGTAWLHLSDKSDASNSLVAGFRPSSRRIPVDLVTLDDYAARQGLMPTVAKIDVEQHELEVIRGAHGMLQRHRPVVVMEVLERGPSWQAHQLLGELGYDARRLGRRDRVYWPERIPGEWDAAFRGWWQAVSRCAPVRPRRRLGARHADP